MKEVIKSYIEISDEYYQHFLNNSEKKEAKKKEILFSPQKSAQKILFVEEGLLRGFKIVDGKDFTHHFFSEKWFATDFESFLKSTPSNLFIEALTKVTYYEFQKEAFIRLYELHHQFEKLGRIIAERAFILTVEKLTEIQTLNLKNRYQRLILNNKELFQKVPQKYIASYLGVSEQSLSRIKNT